MASASRLVQHSLARRDTADDTFTEPEAIGISCEEAVERMEMAAEILLLQSGSPPAALEPVSTGNESYAKSRDAIAANTKGLAISIKELTKQLHQRQLPAVDRVVQQVADQAVILTEAATHAAYLAAMTDVHCVPAEPAVVDRYSFARARQAIRMAYNKFGSDRGPLSREQTIQVSRVLADNIALLTQGCKLAAESKGIGKRDQEQFSHCAQCMQGTTAAFLASLKSFATSHSREDRKRCQLFGKPVLESVNCIIEFANYPQFAGKAAKLSQRGYRLQTEILGGAMAVVGSCVQLLNVTRELLEGGERKSNALRWQKIVNCSRAVADATKLLSSSIREHTPASTRRPSIDQTDPF